MRTPIRAVAWGTAALGALLMFPAGPAFADTTAVVATPNCCASETIAVGDNVYTLSQTHPHEGEEQAQLVRIDTATNAVTGTLGMRFGPPAGQALDVSSMAVAGGSIWVTAYFENEVLRIDPVAMAITASIPVGRSPSSIVAVGSSLWVALNNAQSLVRIDAARNLAVQTVHVGSKDTSDSPWQIAYDGSQLLASMPSSGRVARVDLATGKVRYDNVGFDQASCAHLLPVAGGYWLDDTECGPRYYRWDAKRGRITVALDPTSDTRGDWGAVVARGALYTGEGACTDVECTGYLVKRDPVTGVEIAEQQVGIEALLPHYAAGSFWVGDFDDATLQRVAAF